MSAFFDSLLACLSEGFVFHGADGAIVHSNAAAQRLLGLTADELTGRTADDPRWAVVREDGSPLPGAEHPAAVALATGRAVRDVVMGVRTPDGRLTWLVVGAAPVRDPASGATIGAVATLTSADAERALARLQARYRRLAETATDVVLQTDPDLVIRWVSPSAATMLGRDPDDLEEAPAPSLVAPDDRPGLLAAREAWLAGESVPGLVLRWLTGDGGQRWMSVVARPALDEQGRDGLVLGLHDVDEQVHARHEAQERAALLRANTDAMFDPQILVGAVRDDDGRLVDFTYLEVNRATGEYLSLPPEALLGRRLTDTFPGIGESGLLAALAEALESSEPLVWDDWAYRNEVLGQVRRYDVRAARVADGLSLTWRDVTERHAAAERLAASEHRYRLLAENASDVVLELDPDRVVTWASPSVAELLGWLPEQLVGRPLAALVHGDDAAAAEWDEPAPDAAARELRVAAPGGGWRWMSATAREVRDGSGAPAGAVVSLRDLAAEVAGRRALARSERLFRLALESAPIGMAVVDLDRRFVEVNPALCRMLGCDESWLLSRRVPDILGPDEEAVDLRMRATVLAGQAASATLDQQVRAADGALLVVQHSVGVLRDEDGIPVSYVSQFVDVTAARQAQDRLQFLASHDALTSLANRYELSARLASILSHPPRTGTLLGVLFLDVDDLKTVNDSWGHAAGDALLVEVARRIRATVRADDVVARIGGDEFVVALPATRGIADAEIVAGKIHRALEEPVDIGEGRTVRTGVSVGVAVAEHGDDPSRVLRLADQALYRAKQEGRGRTVCAADERAADA